MQYCVCKCLNIAVPPTAPCSIVRAPCSIVRFLPPTSRDTLQAVLFSSCNFVRLCKRDQCRLCWGPVEGPFRGGGAVVCPGCSIVPQRVTLSKIAQGPLEPERSQVQTRYSFTCPRCCSIHSRRFLQPRRAHLHGPAARSYRGARRPRLLRLSSSPSSSS